MRAALQVLFWIRVGSRFKQLTTTLSNRFRRHTFKVSTPSIRLLNWNIRSASELDFMDAVCPKPDEKISQYLAPSLLGLLDQLAPRELIHSASETRTQFEKTVLVSRATVLKQEGEGAAFPAEFGLVSVRLTEKFRKVKGLYAIIDTDCWLDDRAKFDVGSLEKRLGSLHDEIRRSFDLMVTPYALRVWG